MTWKEAIDAMQNGKRICRKAWLDLCEEMKEWPHAHIYISQGRFPVSNNPHSNLIFCYGDASRQWEELLTGLRPPDDLAFVDDLRISIIFSPDDKNCDDWIISPEFPHGCAYCRRPIFYA